jgi:excisionase family DNA binding protein
MKENLNDGTMQDADVSLMSLKEELQQLRQLVEERVYPPDTILTAKEAATFLQVSIHTIYCYVTAKKIPFYRQLGYLYFSKIELVQWVKSRKGKSISEMLDGANYIAAQIKKGSSASNTNYPNDL